MAHGHRAGKAEHETGPVPVSKVNLPHQTSPPGEVTKGTSSSRRSRDTHFPDNYTFKNSEKRGKMIKLWFVRFHEICLERVSCVDLPDVFLFITYYK